jgi:hypothetical protein
LRNYKNDPLEDVLRLSFDFILKYLQLPGAVVGILELFSDISPNIFMVLVLDADF